MLEKLKKRLTEIRAQRLQDLESFAQGKSDKEREEIKNILMLELPRAMSTVVEKSQNDGAGQWTMPAPALNLNKAENVSAHGTQDELPEELIREWQNRGTARERLEKAAFCDFLRRVEGCGLGVGAIERYKRYAADLTRQVKKDRLSHDHIRNHRLVTPAELARFFDFLETRALKSTTMRSFEDILLCRAIQYIPLTTKKLFSLKCPDGDVVQYGNVEFHLPLSFMRLRAAASKNKMLLYRKFDENQLSKKIKRLGRYAGLPKEFNLSVLRHSTRSICKGSAENWPSSTVVRFFAAGGNGPCLTAIKPFR